jgi:hypothetical protein
MACSRARLEDRLKERAQRGFDASWPAGVGAAEVRSPRRPRDPLLTGGTGSSDSSGDATRGSALEFVHTGLAPQAI